MRQKAIGATVLAVVAAATLAACTQSGGGAGGSNAGTAGGDYANSGAAATAPSRSANLAPNAGRGGHGDAATVSHLTGAAEIRTAQLTVAVRGAQRVAQQADAADTLAVRIGGEVSADDRASGRHASATLILRVPPAALETTLNRLSRLGAERSRELSTVDVTQQVADVTSRVASAKAAIAQLRALYRRAVRIRDVIRVEQQLSSREADLESLQARQRSLANQTAMATITLRLVTAAVAPPKRPHKHHAGGFVGGVERGWHVFSATVGWLALALGTLLPFLLTLLVLGAVAWELRRRSRRAARPPAAPSA